MSFYNVLAKPVIEFRSMPTLLEQRNTLLDEMDGIVNKAKEETRSFSDDESTRFDAIKVEIAKIDKTLAAEEEARSFEKTEIKKAETEEEKRALEIKEDEKRFLEFVREGRAAGMGAPGQNGITIPLTIANKIIDKVYNISPILSKMTTFNVTGDLTFPVYDFTQHTTAYVTEFTAITNTQGTFTQVKLTNNIIGTLAKIGRSLINRSDVDVVSYVINAIAKSIAWFLEKELLNGGGALGSGKLSGLAQISGGQTLTGATTLVIDTVELVKLQLMVPQVYQTACEWYMHPLTLAYIQSLKSTTGKFLMGNTLSEDGRYTILGKPVNVSDNMPQIGVNALEIFYGDMSGLYGKNTKSVEMQVLLEKYADEYAIGIAAFLEMDSTIVEPQKIVAYKGK
jgi:HK97 family phage major capsid protein